MAYYSIRLHHLFFLLVLSDSDPLFLIRFIVTGDSSSSEEALGLLHSRLNIMWRKPPSIYVEAVLFLLCASGSLQGLFGRVLLSLASPRFAVLQKNTTFVYLEAEDLHSIGAFSGSSAVTAAVSVRSVLGAV